MYDENPIQSAGRRKAREQRLGTDAVCMFCLHDQLEALIPVQRSLLEGHHVLGKVNAPDVVVPLCRNCHAKITEQLRRVGASMQESPTLMHRLLSILRALGTFLLELATTVFAVAEQLARFIGALDVRYPGWRAMPEAA